MFNRVCLIGNLGADPEIKYAPSGTCIANIRLAVNDKRKDASGQQLEETYWFQATAFGKIAEVLANYANKGSKIGVDGKLIQRNWEDAQGNKRQSIEIRIDSVELLASQNAGNGGNGHSQSNGQQTRNQGNPPPPPQNQHRQQNNRAGGYPPPPPDRGYQQPVDDIPF
jgi:single-strand DNA-binding protein